VSKLLSVTRAVGIVALGLASVAHLQAQQSASLRLPFDATVAGPAGVVQTSGVFRIAQFAEQNGQIVAVGTLTVGVPSQVSANASSLVTQAIIPVMAVRSGSTSAALNFGGPSSATAVLLPASSGMVTTSSTSGVSVNGTPGVPASAAPGQVANCGPLHLEVGPVDVNQPGLALHVDRLTVDIAPPSGASTGLNQWMCSADAALAQASGGGGTRTGATATIQFAPFSGPNAASATTLAPAGGARAASEPATPLQGLVAVLNQLLVVL
jgi:hypothetical protein